MAIIYGTAYNDNGTFQILPTPIFPGRPSPPLIRFFPILEGTEEADEIYGLRGNDIALGYGGDDSLFGGNDNDELSGGEGNDVIRGGLFFDLLNGDAGDDVLIGVETDPLSFTVSPGWNEIDRLTGGAGADTFVLGDAENVYYDDGENQLFSSDLGYTDYALLVDFTDGQDTIQLKGGVTYNLVPTTVGSDSGIGIYVEKGTREIPIFRFGGSISIPLPDELIGIVQGASLSALTITDGTDITTIT